MEIIDFRYNRAMRDDEEVRPTFLTEEQAARMFAGMNEVIRAGEETRRLRSELITMFAGLGWPRRGSPGSPA
ncbi:hypothetical protein [Streptomyces sp. NPDC059258]|uniref:hypothetical protein n=1 Tax=unclassified Streptomyces TaxID=2593676 RepID=UPI0036CD53DB